MPDVARLAGLFSALPDDLRELALAHYSWVDSRERSYERLAFLGDSVLGLAIAEALYERFPGDGAGGLTKVHAQTVSGRACAEVAVELGLPEMIRNAEPEGHEGAISADELLASERVMSSVCEAVIGACYLAHSYERVAEAVVAAFEMQIALARDRTLDFKSALQEALARDGLKVSYRVVAEEGPAHRRRFEVEAVVGADILGTGAGSSKKVAEQEAARQALEALEGRKG